MLKKIEVWNFESHEHAVLDDISPGVNLLCGDSNVGKSSIIRALRLPAYNEFDPRSVRVGAAKCVVLVETERGTVKVTRGPKDNLWEVTPVGQPTQYFDKVGKGIVPEAARILGLKMVTLGDVQIPVNIMDQLESHFMLSGVGDKEATGSMRAQIVDEISGLSGIEGLIKAVSLDNHRFGREVSETEDRMEETRKQLHDETALKTEEQIVESAGKVLTEYDECVELAATMQSVADEWQKDAEAVEEADRLLATIPDTDAAVEAISKSEKAARKADKAGDILDTVNVVKKRGILLAKEMAALPDVAQAVPCFPKAEKALERARRASELQGSLVAAEGRLKRLEGEAEAVEGAEKGATLVGAASEKLVLVEKAAKMLREVQAMQLKYDELSGEASRMDAELKKACTERDTILASVKTCPLTLKPVSKECLEGAKT